MLQVHSVSQSRCAISHSQRCKHSCKGMLPASLVSNILHDSTHVAIPVATKLLDVQAAVISQHLVVVTQLATLHVYSMCT